MAHEQKHVDAAEGVGFRRCVEFGFRQPKPRHPRVDLKEGRQRAIELAREGSPGVDLGQRVEHGDDVVFDERRFRARKRSMQDVHGRVARDSRAQRDRLVEMRHEEVPASRRVERGSDALCPKPIGVRLHDRAAIGTADPALDRLPVVAYRADVDRQHGARPQLDHCSRASRVEVGRSYRSIPRSFVSIWGLRPLTRSAMTRPVPAAMVQPSVP